MNSNSATLAKIRRRLAIALIANGGDIRQAGKTVIDTMTMEARVLGWSDLTVAAIVPAVEGVAAEICTRAAHDTAVLTSVQS
jgi:hypothetical protein